MQEILFQSKVDVQKVAQLTLWTGRSHTTEYHPNADAIISER